tara:strand:+ start:7275 stop:8111 length:837 start_codon:yes stop_codon:yes gene_type:complete
MANYQSYKQIQGDAAIVANSVGPGQVSGVSTGVAHQFHLFNGNYWNVANGGCCLLWTVPAGTTSVRFELTGGGGTGSIGACCSNGPSGGAGAYATKTLFAYNGDFTAGSTQYTICSGASTDCSCCRQCTSCACCGRRGCRSFVTGSGLSGFCAEGGAWGWHHCSGGCYSCVAPAQCNKCLQICACYNGADFGIPGPSGGKHQNQFCRGTDRSWTGPGVGPYAASTNFGQDNCSAGNSQGCCKGQALFPGGGGISPFTDGGCCWGGWGAGGLVVVSYWQ